MEFKLFFDTNAQILELRRITFHIEKGVDPSIDIDGRDGELLHFCLYEGDMLVSYLRAEITGEVLHPGRVATRTDMRGRGYGRRLFEYVEGYAKENGVRRVELSSMRSAEGFYKKLGYIACGDYYTEAGIPHIFMKKEIGKA